MTTFFRHPAIKAAGFGLGLLLLGAAIYNAWGRVDRESLLNASPSLLLVIGAGVLGNLIASGLLFWVVTKSFDASPPVSVIRMVQLIAASGLLNYLPLRPGLVGRAAYLKARHNLPVKQSLFILAIVLVLGLLVAILVVVSTTIPAYTYSVSVLGVLVLMWVTAPVARVIFRRPVWHAWSWLPLKSIDVLATALRLWAATSVVGQPLSPSTALACAAAGSLVAAVGLTPNGLGLREWTIAGLSELLAPGSLAIAGLGASLDRGLEAIVMTLAGIGSIKSLHYAA
ncbi:MAG: hypothetical protein GC164_01225 [Phycisphaera sp.]|nr:hypothetical protein [Phycisphaera sp.]